MSQPVVFGDFGFGSGQGRRASHQCPGTELPETCASGVAAAEPRERVDSSAHAPGTAVRDRRLAALVHANYALLWRTLRRVGVPEAEIDDALQEVFLVTFRRLDQIDEERERAFLVGVAIRVASTRRRGLRRRRERTEEALADQADPAPTPDELTDRRRARVLLDEILGMMELKFRTVFVLFELEGLEVFEIAELLEIPMGTVGSRLRRARDLFQRAVARHQASSLFPGGRP